MKLSAPLDALRLAYSNPTQLDANQRAVLSQFRGWGQFAPALALHPKAEWLEVADALEEILPEEALNVAREQADTSFYTPRVVVDAVYTILREAGFTGGQVFEPGCGAGAFMDACPQDMDIHFTGVDIDPTAARIASLLHPEHTVVCAPLQETSFREQSFDAVIGNVPFASNAMFVDGQHYPSLHGYFIATAARLVRPGGYVVVVTSRYTLDGKNNGLLNNPIDGMAFVGALRLPSGTFADTSAVTDIVVLRRPLPDEDEVFYLGASETVVRRDDWGYRRAHDNGCMVDTVRTSAYWKDNAMFIAGTPAATGFERAPLRVDGTAEDIARALTLFTASLPQYAHTRVELPVIVDDEGRVEGSFHVIDGKMHRIENGALAPVRQSKELVSLVRLRDYMKELLELESNPLMPDADMDEARTRTREAYELYVARFGHLNRGTLVEGRVDEETGLPALSWRRPAMGGFRRDPDSALVMALEVFDQATGQARPADILSRRVNRRPEPIERVGTPGEALAVSAAETGGIDLDRISGLLGLADASAARQALAGLVFDDPEGGLVSAAEYLSGNVRSKLAAAERAGLDENVQALLGVIPDEVGPLDISMNLGHPLLTPRDIAAFMREEFKATQPSVSFERVTSTWKAEGCIYGEPAIKYGTVDMSVAALVTCALNGRVPEVKDSVYDPTSGKYRDVRNAEKSAAAGEKLELIRDRFSVWVWEDHERSERLVTEYNTVFNSWVPRRFDGAGFTFPRKSATFEPWEHQRAAVERIVSTQAALIGHPVGSGKSATMALSAVTLRELGLANKPLIVVPNHLLEQMAREIQQTIPTARVLVASKEDFAKQNRHVFIARCATGDWDAIVMTHTAFTMLPLSAEQEAQWVFAERQRLVAASRSGGYESAKALARRLRSLETRIKKLRSGVADTDALSFDMLGVDYVMVDEAHMFRRLDTGTSSRSNDGMVGGSSKRATDLLLKVDTLRMMYPDKPVASFFTGTPLSNTLAEFWVWQRFLQPEVLDTLQMLDFSTWVSAFVKYETSIEVAPDGSGFRAQRRPVGLVNFAELNSILSLVADIISPDAVKVQRPDVENVTWAVPAAPEQRAFVQDLANRADEFRNKSPRVRDGGVEDNMLTIIGDGRKVALDPRLVGLNEESPKVAAFADEAARVYHRDASRTFGASDVPGGFQVVFCDLGTPKPGESATYGRLRQALIERGVPAHRIRFVHDATSDKARAALFASCRNGEVSFLFGSTPKLGVGTNIQTRMTDLWNLDAPWLPAEYIQRVGRGDRHGNLSGTVRVHRVVAEGTFDAYTWQTLERKSRSFDALYSAGASVREIEDISAATLSFGELKAIASGNPMLLEQAEAAARVKKLRMMRAVHMQSVSAARASATEAEQMSRKATDQLRVLTSTQFEAPGTLELANTVDSALNGKSWVLNMLQCGQAELRLEKNGAWSLEARYTTAHSGMVPGRVLRRGAEAITAYLHTTLSDLIANIPVEIEQLRERIANLTTLAENSTHAADAAAFAQEQELEDAVVHLARIERAIADTVGT